MLLEELKTKLSKVLGRVQEEESEEFIKGYKWALGVVKLFLSDKEKNSVSYNLAIENKKLSEQIYKLSLENKRLQEENDVLNRTIVSYKEEGGLTNKQINRLTNYFSNILVKNRNAMKKEITMVAYNSALSKVQNHKYSQITKWNEKYTKKST